MKHLFEKISKIHKTLAGLREKTKEYRPKNKIM
jgi:hypothetical protein